MLITLPMSLVDKAIEETESPVLIAAKASTRFVRKLEIEGARLEKPTLKYLVAEAKEISAPYAHNLEFLYALSRNKVKAEFRSITDCEAAITSYRNKDFIKGYVFTREDDGIVYPWLVSKDHSIQNRFGQTDSYPRFTLHSSLVTSNEVNSRQLVITPYTLRRFFDAKDIEYEEKIVTRDKHEELVNCIANTPVAVHDLFEFLNLYKETQDLFDIYDKHLVRFKAFLHRYGSQFVVRGTADANTGNWWYKTKVDLSVDNSPGRAIMTTVPVACIMSSEVNDQGSRRQRSRRTGGDSDESDFLVDVENLDIPLKDLEISDIQVTLTVKLPGAEPDAEVPAPLHPVLNVFHLTHHQLFAVHVANLAPYKYKDNIKDQLVLPDEMKELSEMLVSTDEEDSEDVIENKSQATIIACIGDPGLGKTLLAEVISEECKKPLYKIQAAQLGMTHEELETNLSKILKRAEAWNCVLMIDEANAYIHERGHDIRQNAIVGVFLRLLEYFKGTLILTTNHAGAHGGIDIDDAIVSRCSAVFRFTTPTVTAATQIWKLQAKLLKIKLDPDVIESLTSKYKISGRSIRNLLRLTNRYAKRLGAETLRLKHFEACAKYIPTTQSEIIQQKVKAS